MHYWMSCALVIWNVQLIMDPKTFWKYCWNVIRINQWSSLNKCSICFRLVKRGQDKNWIIPESLWAETTTTMNSTLTLEIVILRQILMFLRLTWTCLKYEIANVSTWTWKHSEITKRKKISYNNNPIETFEIETCNRLYYFKLNITRKEVEFQNNSIYCFS